jgi:hypothetical protein
MTSEAGAMIRYGLHFYPGVAEYRPPDQDPFRVFLNESTIRSMDASFEGKPVFVLHVDEVETDLEKLRKQADGWVVESFYNKADGKHWCKFIIVSERGKSAIRRDMRLSNAYKPTKPYGPGGLWNGLDYDKEVTGGEYQHLALVPDPRYDESVIMTAEEFKAYNEEKLLEVERISNEKESRPMPLNLFKRDKLKNSTDFDGVMIELPKSKREVLLTTLVNEMDDAEEKKKKDEKEPPMANGEHMVEYGGAKMTVNEMCAAHKALHDEMEEMRKNTDDPDEKGEDDDKTADDKTGELKKNAEEAAAKAETAKNELEAARTKAAEKAKAAKEKADRLANARDKPQQTEGPTIDTMSEQIARGQSRYGSDSK